MEISVTLPFARGKVQVGLLDITEVLKLVQDKPPQVHIILTGRDAHPDLVARADMVTEMRSVKHPYDRGLAAQKGIDF